MKAQIGAYITGFRDANPMRVIDSLLRDNLQSRSQVNSQSAAQMNKFLVLNCDKLFKCFPNNIHSVNTL